MRFALHFANMAFPHAADAHRVCRAAEDAGFESAIAIEHVVVPVEYASRYPYSNDGRLPAAAHDPLPDPLIWMTWAAAVTTRLRFITGVLILPQRNPLVLAKEVATLAHLSGGRVELGVGVGWLEEEFDAVGVPFGERGRRTDDHIGALRALWRDETASYAGEFTRFEGVACSPRPPGGSVPIVVGGITKVAARRAGRLGDGFFPATGATWADLPAIIGWARQAAEDAGRDPAALEITTGCPGLAGADPVGAVEERAAMGATRIAVPAALFTGTGAGDVESALRHFGETVIAKVS